MKRKSGVITAAAVAAVAAVMAVAVFVGISSLSSSLEGKEEDGRVFHATLADPELYVDGVFSGEFSLDPGEYRLRFTPNGDSPEVLSIMIKGQSTLLEEDFELKGTPHITETARYYTWEYLGNKTLGVIEPQTVRITINPHGNVLGPVSVSLIRE